ncbi:MULTISPECIES: flagellar biosynthetic protein FliO [Mesorhizobium]|uniref:Flagellar biosynthesis protein FliO n=1 Tax=Mesorhizobium denitrificans TaxID=2294114 RepID=A0A371X6G6_9HYPH|nr:MULTISPECIES: flagellar biosynthetic protein FliO [Mesorhizobium]RFC64826.1 hypothetical protein DY251_17820 [Mesorhizobium denitrificans]
MSVWIDRIVGAENAPVAFWVIVACAVLIALYLIYLLIKRFRSGTYVAGGRNRKARLAIMDATAVDTHRRLVLVRRDDVEHLLLIGGHSDIVVERDIRVHGTAKRPTMVGEAAHSAEAPVAPPRTQNVRTEPVHAPVAHPPVPHREPLPPARPAAPRQTVQIQQRPVPAPPPARNADELDSDLLKELETALDNEDVQPQPQPSKGKSSLDEEMAKLLGELSSHKR